MAGCCCVIAVCPFEFGNAVRNSTRSNLTSVPPLSRPNHRRILHISNAPRLGVAPDFAPFREGRDGAAFFHSCSSPCENIKVAVRMMSGAAGKLRLTAADERTTTVRPIWQKNLCRSDLHAETSLRFHLRVLPASRPSDVHSTSGRPALRNNQYKPARKCAPEWRRLSAPRSDGDDGAAVGRLRRYESSSLRGARLEGPAPPRRSGYHSLFWVGAASTGRRKANARPDVAAFAYLIIFKSS
jgi:hypothetical protein